MTSDFSKPIFKDRIFKKSTKHCKKKIVWPSGLKMDQILLFQVKRQETYEDLGNILFMNVSWKELIFTKSKQLKNKSKYRAQKQ